MDSAPGRQTTGARHHMIMVMKEVCCRCWILDHRRRDVDAHFGHTEHRGCTTIHQFSQNGSTCACKKVLKAKADESRGILLPMHAFIPLSKPDEHPRVCCGAPTGGLWPKYPRLLIRISERKVMFQKVWAAKRQYMCIQVGLEG